MLVKKIFLILSLALTYPVKAQLFYTADQSIPVEFNSAAMSLPWAGGLNSPQFNTMDLNGDQQEDLVVYDRTVNKIMTFLNLNKVYHYAPEYEVLFPSAVHQWLLLRDINCDGKKDIFTSDPFGMKAFINITPPGGVLAWRPFNGDLPILTIGFSGPGNLQVNGTDIPAIDDVDGDGDLDILDARFSGIGSLEYHKNMSIENTGVCDSMQFKRVTLNWGNFEECNCGEYVYGVDSTCSKFGGGRITHAAGKSSITIDMDGDGDRDLLFSEETCRNLYLMPNTGTPDSAVISSFSLFTASTPANLQIFPAAYFEDVDFDGLPDLIVANNIHEREDNAVNFRQSAWLYKNTGTSQIPNFTFIKNNFLQDQMIEVGDNAVPAFFDEDGDGDQDLFVGNFIGPNGPASIRLYRNTGTANEPAFTFVTDDYAGLSAQYMINLRPQFADMNSDNKIDLVFTATDSLTNITTLKYILNKNALGLNLLGQPVVDTQFPLTTTENIQMVDVNQDGRIDALVGRASGAVEYWINNGPAGSIQLTLQNSAYLGLSASPDRQNPALAVGDLDSDGKLDLLMGNPDGTLSFFRDFRSEAAQSIGQEDLFTDNPFIENAQKINLGGPVWPAVVKLVANLRPVLVIGNSQGGLTVMKNDASKDLPVEPVISIYPNPIQKGDGFSLSSDRNATVEFVSVLGQRCSEEVSISANIPFLFSTQGLSSGVYIARLSINGKSYSRKFIVY